MERPVNNVNYVLLERLAREDYDVNGWRDIVNDWMLDYRGYFEEDVDEEYPAGQDEDDDNDDEGIGEDSSMIRCLTMSACRTFHKVFCVVMSYVIVHTRASYALCTRCYGVYVELYFTHGMDHNHIMRHKTFRSLEDACRELRRRKCESCLTSLCQIVPQDICLCCND